MTQQLQTQTTKAVTPVDEFRGSLERLAPQLKSVLPAHVSPEKFNRVVMTAIQKTPSLLQCDRSSLFAACLSAATDGLLPDGRESALVKYGDKVTYLPMVGGILKKIRNSGELSSISPHNVYDGDEFDYFVDEKGEHLKHRRNFDALDAKIKCSYVVAIMKDGGVYIEVMTVPELELIRGRSRSGNNGPWITDRPEMYKKTVLKRLSKRLPMSTDIEFNDEGDDYGPQVPTQTATTQETSTSAAQEIKSEPLPSKPTPRLKGAMAAVAVPTTSTPAPSGPSPEGQEALDRLAANNPNRVVAKGSMNPPPHDQPVLRQEEPPPMDFNDVPI